MIPHVKALENCFTSSIKLSKIKKTFFGFLGAQSFYTSSAIKKQFVADLPPNQVMKKLSRPYLKMSLSGARAAGTLPFPPLVCPPALFRANGLASNTFLDEFIMDPIFSHDCR